MPTVYPYIGGTPSKARFTKNNGTALSGGKIYFYEAGTSTPKDTYSESTGVTANANPVVLDSRGEADIFLQGDGAYKIVVKDSNDVQIYSVDDIYGYGDLGDLADTTSPSLGDALVGGKRTDTGAVAFTLHDFHENRVINVKTDFLATGNGATNDTLALQAALDAAAETSGRIRYVFVPFGRYKFSQLIIPIGVGLMGEGTGGFGASAADNTTVLEQIDGVDDDAIIFETFLSSSIERVQGLYLRNFILVKASGTTDTLGHGIAFRKAGTRTDDANHAILIGNCLVENLIVRGFPENGIYARRGSAGPCTFRNINPLFNGGYGIRWDGFNVTRSLLLEDIYGDGNTGGAVIRLAMTSSNNVTTIVNLSGEYRANSEHGATSGFGFAQPRLLEVGDCGASHTVINYIGGVLSSTETENPDCAIFVNTSADNLIPTINVDGVVVVQDGAKTGTAVLLKDDFNSVSIPLDLKRFQYSRKTNTAALAGPTQTHVVGDTGTAPTINVGSQGHWSRGTVPFFGWWETDAAADEKGWAVVANGGDLTCRTMTDAGVTAVFLELLRTGNLVTLFNLSAGFQCSNAVMSFTGIPTFADDAAAGTGGLAAGRVYMTSTGELRIKT